MENDLGTVLDIVLAGRRIARFISDVDENGFATAEEKRATAATGRRGRVRTVKAGWGELSL
jgi:hypothetical protein